LPVDFDLYLITDRHQCGEHGLLTRVEQALQGGVKAVQLREKDLPTRERYELARELRTLTSDFNAMAFINGDAALALAVGADGVHLPQNGLPIDACRRILEPHMLIGVSTHSLEEARNAERNGADFITFGPVYQTSSKKQYGSPVGIELLRSACQVVQVPVFGVGGISAAYIKEVISAGAAGIAVISAILSASDVKDAASQMIAYLRKESSGIIRKRATTKG
jgi:thiamine-phosphate pyrophosphorylase